MRPGVGKPNVGFRVPFDNSDIINRFLPAVSIHSVIMSWNQMKRLLGACMANR